LKDKMRKYPVNPLYPALKRLPFSGFQSSLIADRRGSAIRPAVETLQNGWQLPQWTTGSPDIYQNAISRLRSVPGCVVKRKIQNDYTAQMQKPKPGRRTIAYEEFDNLSAGKAAGPAIWRKTGAKRPPLIFSDHR